MKTASLFSAIPFLLLCAVLAAARDSKQLRVLLWSEQTEPREVYPKGQHDDTKITMNRLLR